MKVQGAQRRESMNMVHGSSPKCVRGLIYYLSTTKCSLLLSATVTGKAFMCCCISLATEAEMLLSDVEAMEIDEVELPSTDTFSDTILTGDATYRHTHTHTLQLDIALKIFYLKCTSETALLKLI